MRRLTAISLFTGGMGLDIGVENAGFNIKVAVEMDKWACETIRLNRPKLPLIDRDISEISTSEILYRAGLNKDEVDLVVGGPPCQSFSTAGRRRSLLDDKGSCVLQFIRIIEQIRPKAFIMENVRGLLSSKVGMEGLKVTRDGKKELVSPDTPVAQYIKNKFRELGYDDADFKLLNAADFGVPQKRERVFFIGTLFKSEFEFPAPTHFKNPTQGQSKWVTFAEVLKSMQNIHSHTYIPYAEDRRKYMLMIPRGGGNWRDLSPEIQKEAMGKAYHSGGGKVGFFRRIKLNEPSPTLLTSPNQKATMLGHPIEDRPLSVEEYKAIQQFPLDWQLPGSISEKYKLIGNAVPTGLAYVVAKQVYEYIIDNEKNETDDIIAGVTSDIL